MGWEASAHLEHLRARNLRPSYIKSRRTLLRRLEVHIGKSPLDATLDDLRSFLDRGVSAATRATELAHLRSFYRWAMAEELLDRDPTLRLERPKVPLGQPRPIAGRDLAKAFGAADGPMRLMLALAAYAGLRCCEIAPLHVDDVLLAALPPLLVIREGKGGKAGTVPIAPPLAQVLFEQMPTTGWFFPRVDGTGPLSANRVSQLVGRYLRGLGINATCHQLRHWYGTELYRTTHDLRVTQTLMRHARSSTTDRYTWIDPHEGVAAVARLPAL